MEGKYSTLTFQIGHLDGSSESNGVLDVYLDGASAGSYTIPWDALPQTVTVDLAHASQLKLEWKGGDGRASCGLLDIAFS